LRLTAPGLGGSAALPVSSEPVTQTPAHCAARNNRQCKQFRKETSGIQPAKTRTLKGGGAKGVCGMGKGGACRPGLFRARPTGADSVRVRGRTPNIAPWPNPIRSERGISPAHCSRAPDRHRQRPRPLAWSAQRIEQVAVRQRQTFKKVRRQRIAPRKIAFIRRFPPTKPTLPTRNVSSGTCRTFICKRRRTHVGYWNLVNIRLPAWNRYRLSVLCD
jgi:hypothetical protein